MVLCWGDNTGADSNSRGAHTQKKRHSHKGKKHHHHQKKRKSSSPRRRANSNEVVRTETRRETAWKNGHHSQVPFKYTEFADGEILSVRQDKRGRRPSRRDVEKAEAERKARANAVSPVHRRHVRHARQNLKKDNKVASRSSSVASSDSDEYYYSDDYSDYSEYY